MSDGDAARRFALDLAELLSQEIAAETERLLDTNLRDLPADARQAVVDSLLVSLLEGMRE